MTVKYFDDFDAEVNDLIAEYEKDYPDYLFIGNDHYDWYFNDMVGNYPEFWISISRDYEPSDLLPNGASIEYEVSNFGVAADYGAFKVKEGECEAYYEDYGGAVSYDSNVFYETVDDIKDEVKEVAELFADDLNEIIDRYTAAYDYD